MPTTRAHKATAANRATTRKQTEPDAIELLKADHKQVKKLFKDYDKLIDKGDARQRAALVRQICQELIVHTEVEESIFYPALRQEDDTDRLLDEALVEHAGAKALIAQLGDMKPSDPLYDAKVIVLGEYINHHVKEEETEMFPLAAKKKLDLAELGEAMSRKKEQLTKGASRLS
ncbi:hemerythrin domain-containing protein [Chitinimonas naiadis]